jgi:hypothetical protein
MYILPKPSTATPEGWFSWALVGVILFVAVVSPLNPGFPEIPATTLHPLSLSSQITLLPVSAI